MCSWIGPQSPEHEEADDGVGGAPHGGGRVRLPATQPATWRSRQMFSARMSARVLTAGGDLGPRSQAATKAEAPPTRCTPPLPGMDSWWNSIIIRHEHDHVHEHGHDHDQEQVHQLYQRPPGGRASHGSPTATLPAPRTCRTQHTVSCLKS